VRTSLPLPRKIDVTCPLPTTRGGCPSCLASGIQPPRSHHVWAVPMIAPYGGVGRNIDASFRELTWVWEGV
jgi:hypothetical protein